MSRTSNVNAARTPIQKVDGVKGRDDRGDTLIEVLMALLVLSLCALAVMIAFSTSISASQQHRDLATANIVLASASQQAISQIQQNSNLFGCGASTQNPPVTETTYVLDSVQITPAPNYGNFTATVYNVEYWNGTTFQSNCIPHQDPPLEVTIQVNGIGGPYYNTFVVDLPSGNLGAANNLSNGVISQFVFSSINGGGATGSTGVPFSPQPVVVALDSNSEIVGNSYPAIQIAIESGPTGTSSISGCSANDPNGIASFSGCTITGPAGTYVLTASWGGINSDPSGIGLNQNTYNPLGSPFWNTSPNYYTTTFSVVVAGAPDKVVFGQAPVAAASGATLTKQPTINIDTPTNPLKVDPTQNGTVTMNISGGSMSGCTGPGVTITNNGDTITATVTAGTVTLAGCKFSGAIFYNATASPAGPDATIYAVSASFTGAVTASSQISVTGPGAATQLVFVQQPSGVSNSTANAKWPQLFAVEIEDAFGNPVYTDNASSISAAFDATDAVHETLSNCAEASVADSATATFTNCEGSAYGGGLKIKASYGNPAITQDSAPFSISGSAASLVFTTQPVAGQSGSAFTTQPVVEILDNLGNVDTGYANAVILTPSAGTISGCPGQAPNTGSAIPNNGYAAFQACLFAGNPGTSYTLTASINSGAITVKSAAFSPSQAGVATQLAFTTQPVAGAVAGSVMTTQPVVSVEDSEGNVTTSTATIKITYSGNATGNTNCANLTAVLGVVNVSNCTFGGTIGQQYTMTATSPGLAPATSAPFASNTAAGTEAGVQITAAPTSVPASNVTNSLLSFQVIDAWGNDTVSNGATVLTVSSTSTGGFFGAGPGVAGPLGTSSTVLIPSGAPTATEYYGDELAGTPTIFAYDAGTPQKFGSTTLTIAAGAASQLVYSNAPPTTTTAGTKFSVGVTEEDQFNNVVSTDNGTTVSLAASNGSTSGGFNCTSTSATVSGGVATFSNCNYTSASPTAYVLTASAGGLTPATASTTVSAGPAAKVAVWSGNSQSAKINTAFAQPLSVIVSDASGNPVAGATVKFTTPGGNPSGKFASAANVLTNAQGIATSSTLTAGATAGTYQVTATVTGVGTPATFSETNTNVTATLAFVSAAQTFTTNAAGTTSGSVIVQTQDGNGNPVIQTSALIVTLTYKPTGTLTFSTDPGTVTIPAGSSTGSFTVAASAVTGTPTFTIAAAAPGFTGATTAANTVRAGVTTSGSFAPLTPVTITSASQNAVYTLTITNSTAANLWYSVVNENGLMAGETAVASPDGTCVAAARNGGKAIITETVNVGTNRPSGMYAFDFVVESFSTNNFGGCGGANTYLQADGNLTVTLGASSIAVNGGYGQQTTNGTSFNAPLSVIVTDANGSPVAGTVVTFTAPTTGASGTFLALTNGGACVASGTPNAIAVTSCTATTNVNGLASTLTFTANTVTGVFAVQASTTVTTPASVTFEEENQ
jgi:type II secretory pathway pseudopilin PulG